MTCFFKLHFQVTLLPHGCMNSFMFLLWEQERERKGKSYQLCFWIIFFPTYCFSFTFSGLHCSIPTFEREYHSIISSWPKYSPTQPKARSWYPLHGISSAGNTGHGEDLEHLSHLSHGHLLWSPQLLNYLLTLLPSACATLWDKVKEKLLNNHFWHERAPGIPVEHRLTKPVCTLVVTTEFRLVTCSKGELEQIWAGERRHDEVTTLFHHRAAPAYRKSSWCPSVPTGLSLASHKQYLNLPITSLFFGLWSKSSKNIDNCCGTVIIWCSVWIFRWHKYLVTHSQRDRGDPALQCLTSRHTAPHKIHPAPGQDFATWS